jgi:hypothetical protein
VSDRGGPRSAAPEASSGSRFRRERRERRLPERRFFYPEPVRLDPTLDGDFVPLNGPALWLLWAPAQRVQDPSDMVDMKTNPEDLLDHMNDPGTGPQVRRKACLAGALQQDRFQSFLGPLIESWRSTRLRLGPDGFRPALQDARFPAPDAAAVNPNLACYLSGLESLIQVLHGPQASPFQELCASGWSHRFPPHQSIGHLLCRCQ